jgi:Predicted membrane protein (DUF2232)
MNATIFMALAAGLTSALMFASIVSGALFSLLLCYLAPLPLLVAGLGWGPLCAAIGGILASVSLTAIFGIPYGFAFTIVVALPAWWLGHLVLLGRPIAPDMPSADAGLSDEPELEWYPVGRILLWTAGFASLSALGALLTLGLDAATINGLLHRGLLRLFTAQGLATNEDIERIIDMIVTLAPAAIVSVTMTTLTLNLWLAAKITETSGRLRRPWPDLRNTTLPPMTLAALCVAIAFCFTGGLFAIVAVIAVAALMLVYAFVGFAVLHILTLRLRSRPFWLSTTYTIVVVFSWPILAFVALGIADALFDIRRRARRGKPPPLPAA